MFPLVEELQPAPDAVEVFLRLRDLSHCLFLDSAQADPKLGQYSFVAADPFEFLELTADGADGLKVLAQRMSEFSTAPLPGFPPFQGGAAGMFGYDLARDWERLPRPATDEFQTPRMAVGLYDVVVAFDHAQGRAWIVSQGFPETDRVRREQRAGLRLREFRARLLEARAPRRAGSEAKTSESTITIAQQFPVTGLRGLTSNFSRESYLQAVERVIDYIRAGDVFQVNLSQRLVYPAKEDAASLYLRLRRLNPASFAAYFDLGSCQIVSASPERFLEVRDGDVETRPIKGTRPRFAEPAADERAADELLSSAKDRAENVMIVDLMRNDLSQACWPDSVKVTQLCELEKCKYVQHLVSAVRGQLREDCGPIDLLRAAFPGGSVTGAPKLRAMEIIAELEPTVRGPYCGALGYIGFDGTMDTSILIRTITAGRGWLQFPVGGGIVADSDPEREYEETWHKAEGLIQAIRD